MFVVWLGATVSECWDLVPNSEKALVLPSPRSLYHGRCNPAITARQAEPHTLQWICAEGGKQCKWNGVSTQEFLPWEGYSWSITGGNVQRACPLAVHAATAGSRTIVAAAWVQRAGAGSAPAPHPLFPCSPVFLTPCTGHWKSSLCLCTKCHPFLP